MANRMYGRLLFNSVEAIIRNVKYTNKQRLLLFNGNIDNNVMVKRCLAATSVVFSGDDKNIVRSPFPDVVVPNIPFPNFIWDDNAKTRGEHIALKDAITGKSYTYAEAKDVSDRFGSAMFGLGIRKDDVVAFFMANSPDYITCLTGLIGMGAIVTPINPNCTATELARQLKMSKAKAIITESSPLAVVREAVEQVDAQKAFGFEKISKIVVLGEAEYGTIGYGDLIKDAGHDKSFHDADFQRRGAKANPNFDKSQVALLPYSSGTTGLPKGVMLTSDNLVSNICQSADSRELGFVEETTDMYQPKTLCIMPMFHAFNNVAVLPTLRSGGQVITLPKFDPTTFIEALIQYRPHILHLAPPVVSFLANNEDVKFEHLTSIRRIFVAAAPFGETLAHKFLEKAPHVKFREAWGMTELSPLATVTPESNAKIGSCGVLIANTEGKIVDMSTGEALGPYKSGELCIRGPQVMKGYLDNPEATADTIKSDGWLHSGDVAYYDDEGRFYIVDRLKELIKVKGFQVAPAELEDLLRSHPKIFDVGVIGIPDERSGEVPLAFIVKKPYITLDEEEVHSFVNERVVNYKRLSGGIKFIEAIPKTASGKILRTHLTIINNTINTS